MRFYIIGQEHIYVPGNRIGKNKPGRYKVG